MTRFTLTLSVLFAATSAFAQKTKPDPLAKPLADTFAELLPKMAAGDSAAQQKWQDACFLAGAPGNEKLRAEACSLMTAKLDSKTPAAARLWLLAQLQRIGREESVEAVAAVIDDADDEVREAAVRALANNPSPKATGKLTAKLPDAKGSAKVGLLNALGHRADPAAVAVVAKELASAEEAVAVAAARALGRIPGAEALKALAAGTDAKKAVRAAIADARIVHADRLQKEKKTAEAAAIYKELNTPDEPRAVRLAALRGVIQTAGDKAGELVLGVLAGDDTAARAVAVGQIENLSAAALKPLAASLDKLPVPSRVQVITAIAARGDRSQLPVAVAAAKNDSADVKRAGVLALGRLGDATTVEFLLELMSGKDATAGVAAESLAALSADKVNEKLVAVLDAEKAPARRAALIGILERRKAAGAVPSLLKAAGDADAQVRTAAFAGLKSLAAPEHLPAMIAALPKTAKGGQRDAAELAIVAVASQIPEAGKRPEAALAAYKAAPKEQAADLLPLLGRLGGADALKAIRDAAGTDPAVRAAALAGLFHWPDVSANDDLLAVAEKGADADKRAALRALVRVNAAVVDRTPDERLAALAVMKKAMELAARDEERRVVLEGIGFVRHIDTLRYVVPYLDKPELAQAACKGVVELAHSKMLREPNRAEFAKALDRVIAICKDKGLVERAREYKNAP